MRLHLGKSSIATTVLVELGAVAGTLIGVCYCTAWALSSQGLNAATPHVLMGSIFYGGLVGAPLGALVLPAAILGFLRHVPLGRAIAFPLAGSLLGTLAAAALAPTIFSMSGPVIIGTGVLVGVTTARLYESRLVPRHHPARLDNPSPSDVSPSIMAISGRSIQPS